MIHVIWFLDGTTETIEADTFAAAVVLQALTPRGLVEANLNAANLSWANLSGADLSGANLSGANLSWANLSWANLSGANLSGATLIGADLSGANLSGANLSGANLIGANPSGANLSGANLIGAAYTIQSMAAATTDSLAVFSDGSRHPARASYDETDDELDTEAYTVQERGPTGRGRLVGVELEFNSASDWAPIRRWADAGGHGIHEDGSCGWELVTRAQTPAAMSSSLVSMGQALRSAEAEADDRCGVHVHVSALDLTWSDMRTLIALYARCEPLLYVLAGQNRIQCKRYAKPVGVLYEQVFSADWKGRVMKYLAGTYTSGDALRKIRDGIDKKDGMRYHGLNIAPWLAGKRAKRGDTTVEFRSHRATLDTRRVASWASLCHAMVSWSKRHDARDVKLFDGQLQALCHVSPESKPWIVQRIQTWRRATSVTDSGVKRLISYTPKKDFFIVGGY